MINVNIMSTNGVISTVAPPVLSERILIQSRQVREPQIPLQLLSHQRVALGDKFQGVERKTKVYLKNKGSPSQKIKIMYLLLEYVMHQYTTFIKKTSSKFDKISLNFRYYSKG